MLIEDDRGEIAYFELEDIGIVWISSSVWEHRVFRKSEICYRLNIEFKNGMFHYFVFRNKDKTL